MAGRPTKLDFSCRYGWSVATPNPATMIGLSVNSAARSGEQITIAAAPSVCGQQSSRWSGWHTGGEASTSSTVTSLRKWAYGSSLPLWWFFTATAARCSRVVPNSCMCRVANGANSTGADSPRVRIG